MYKIYIVDIDKTTVKSEGENGCLRIDVVLMEFDSYEGLSVRLHKLVSMYRCVFSRIHFHVTRQVTVVPPYAV